MKTNIISFACLFLSLHSFYSTAQPLYYFTAKTEPYVYLSGGNSLLTSSTDTIYLGFDIKIGSVVNDTIYITKNGAISTSGLDTLCPMLYSFGAEHSQGQYLYKVDTMQGKRIVKLQFQNVKFDHDFTGLDFANFQVWFYEVDKSIEVRFGNSNVINYDWSYYFAKGGPALGFKNFWLKGDLDSPIVDTATAGIYLSGTPDSGQVYRFTLDPPPIHNTITSVTNNNYIAVYPNPSAGSFYINTGNQLSAVEAIIIRDMMGRTAYSSGPLPPGSLLQTGLSPGMYIMDVRTDQRHTALRLIVQ